MILDSGICEISRKINTAEAGYMPVFRDSVFHTSWYGLMAFETAPVWPTEGREEIQTDARIRILQHRGIGQHDRVKLYPLDPETGRDLEPELYEVRRAWHGTDAESGEEITDLTLIRTESGWEAPEGSEAG